MTVTDHNTEDTLHHAGLLSDHNQIDLVSQNNHQQQSQMDVDEISAKAFHKLASLQRKINHSPRHLKELAYLTDFCPKLEYCATV